MKTEITVKLEESIILGGRVGPSLESSEGELQGMPDDDLAVKIFPFQELIIFSSSKGVIFRSLPPEVASIFNENHSPTPRDILKFQGYIESQHDLPDILKIKIANMLEHNNDLIDL